MTLFSSIAITLGRFGVPPSNTDVTADAHAATLFSNLPAQRCAFREAWKLFGTVDEKGDGLDLQAEVNMSPGRHGVPGHPRGAARRPLIGIFVLLDVLVQTETQSILALMSDRQIWEDEVSSGVGTVQIHHSCDRSPSQDGSHGWSLGHTAMRDLPSWLEGGEQEEIGIVGESDILLFLAFVDFEFHHGRWIDRPTVCRRCRKHEKDFGNNDGIQTYTSHQSHMLSLFPAVG